jgi:hypothetical protein
MNAMTWKQIKDASLQLMFSFVSRGILRTKEQNADYLLCMCAPANFALLELAVLVPVRRFVVIRAYADENTADGFSQDGEQACVTSCNARAFFCEISGNGTVYFEHFEDNGYVTDAVRNVANPYFAPLRYAYPLRCSARVRISGNARLRDAAFYANEYAEPDIPSPAANRTYRLSELIAAQDGLSMMKLADKPVRLDGRDISGVVQFDGIDRLTIPGALSGEVFVHYHAYPAEITPQTPDAHVVELCDEAAALVPYWIASAVCAEDDMELGALYAKRFAEGKARLEGRCEALMPDEFQSVSGW